MAWPAPGRPLRVGTPSTRPVAPSANHVPLRTFLPAALRVLHAWSARRRGRPERAVQSGGGLHPPRAQVRRPDRLRGGGGGRRRGWRVHVSVSLYVTTLV